MTRRADSPIVEAVRKAREDLARDCDYDLGKLLARLKRDEHASGRTTGTPPRRIDRKAR